MLVSGGLRKRLAGTNAWTAASGKRRWPPGVVNEGIWPRSAHRRNVFGVTPSLRLASPSVSQPAASPFLAKTNQIYNRVSVSRAARRVM